MISYHFLISRHTNQDKADKTIQNLLKIFEVTPINKNTLIQASIDNGSDYEDSVIYTSAHESNIDIIISRDKKGFTQSKISTLQPKEFLAFFNSTKN